MFACNVIHIYFRTFLLKIAPHMVKIRSLRPNFHAAFVVAFLHYFSFFIFLGGKEGGIQALCSNSSIRTISWSQMFYKIGAYKNFEKFAEKHLCWCLSLWLSTLLKKRLWCSGVPVNCTKFTYMSVYPWNKNDRREDLPESCTIFAGFSLCAKIWFDFVLKL